MRNENTNSSFLELILSYLSAKMITFLLYYLFVECIQSKDYDTI